MKTFIVRVHFYLRGESAAEVRYRMIDALDDILEIEGLEAACIDNQDEITIESTNANK